MQTSPSLRRTPRAHGGASSQSMRRSGSDASSSSSDIHVAYRPDPSIPATATRNGLSSTRPLAETRLETTENANGLPIVSARVVTASFPSPGKLCVKLPSHELAALMSPFPTSKQLNQLSKTTKIDTPTAITTSQLAHLDAGDGPNARGTYSKEYTLRHPEITWTHRGQGRYLPSSDFISDVVATSHRPQRPSRFSLQAIDDHSQSTQSPQLFQPQHPALSRTETQESNQSGTGTPDTQRRKRRAVHETLQDSLSPTIPVYGLRHRPSLRPTPLTPAERSQPRRPSRRFQSLPNSFSTDKSSGRGRRDESSESDVESSESDIDDSNRRQPRSSNHNHRERLLRRTVSDDIGSFRDDGDEDSMIDSDDTRTYTKEYVNDHPNETFHHVGNGWYKRGHRGKKARLSRVRETNDNVEPQPDGSYSFDPNRTIHSSQLSKFPGLEFHHAGNGWYKLGPMPSAKRTSIQIPMSNTAKPSVVDNLDDLENMERLTKTVSKEHTLQHPEVEWVHRGNGRYIAKDVRTLDSPALSMARPSAERRTIGHLSANDQASIDAQLLGPDVHLGNSRSRRTSNNTVRPPQSPATSSRRPSIRRDTSAHDEGSDDSDALFDKVYVDAHPHLEFHHRGQGRYKRGPRNSAAPPPSSLFVEPVTKHRETAEAVDVLVDTAYVEAHPNETFYHKGQGRWARGLPPLGSSNKTAVRGPGAKTRSEADKTQEDDENAKMNGEAPPSLTALVVKSDGPEKWPHLQWHYRGGGKWSRMTKTQWDTQHSATQNFNVATFSRYTPRRSDDSSRREDTETNSQGAEGNVTIAENEVADQPAVKRRRRAEPNTVNQTRIREDNQQSSQSHSHSATPQLQMLAPEDDILGPDDLPDLYRDSFSPIDPDEDDAAGRLYRELYRPLNVGALLKALTKHDAAVRPMDSLLMIARNTQEAMQTLQDEYLELEKITASHSRVPRKPARGGRLPVPMQVFEDKKEAELYDYNYDPRKIGFQDPIAQRVMRDAEGRELRKRRARNALDHSATLPGWDFGDGTDLGSKRQSRQPARFDGNPAPQGTRRRGIETDVNVAPSVESGNRRGQGSAAFDQPHNSHLAGPIQASQSNVSFQPATTGRWAGHVPKRIRELQREGSVSSVRSDGSNNSVASGESVVNGASNDAANVLENKKGRSTGARSHHARRETGVKKGSRRSVFTTNSLGGQRTDDEGDHVEGEVTEAGPMMSGNREVESDTVMGGH